MPSLNTFLPQTRACQFAFDYFPLALVSVRVRVRCTGRGIRIVIDCVDTGSVGIAVVVGDDGGV